MTFTLDPTMQMRWFLNEEANPYLYNAAKQEADFPNDFHTAYENLSEAVAAAEALA